MFVFYVILTISYLRTQTIETSSLSTDSSRPLLKQIEIFSILTVCLYISTVSTFLSIRASYESASSGRNPCGGNKHLESLPDTSSQIFDLYSLLTDVLPL